MGVIAVSRQTMFLIRLDVFWTIGEELHISSGYLNTRTNIPKNDS